MVGDSSKIPHIKLVQRMEVAEVFTVLSHVTLNSFSDTNINNSNSGLQAKIGSVYPEKMKDKSPSPLALRWAAPHLL